MTITFESRFERQKEFVPAVRLQDLPMTVIGLGAIGRQVALQLAAIGASRLQLIDFDVVEPTNIVTQGYQWIDAEERRPKVEAARQSIRSLNPDIDVQCIVDRYRPQHRLAAAVFVCVDSISARTAIWRSAGLRCEFWCDGRMLGDTIRVLAAFDVASRQHYETTLFDQSDAQRGRCTARSTIYAASIAAGLMVHQLTRWLREMRPTSDAALNLLADELSALET